MWNCGIWWMSDGHTEFILRWCVQFAFHMHRCVPTHGQRQRICSSGIGRSCNIHFQTTFCICTRICFLARRQQMNLIPDAQAAQMDFDEVALALCCPHHWVLNMHTYCIIEHKQSVLCLYNSIERAIRSESSRVRILLPHINREGSCTRNLFYGNYKFPSDNFFYLIFFFLYRGLIFRNIYQTEAR